MQKREDKGAKAEVRVYNFAPLIKEDSLPFFFAAEKVFGLMDLAGNYWEKSSVEEVLSFLEGREKAVLLSFGGMLRDFHVFKGHRKVSAQGRWTVRIGKLFGFDLMGYASFTGHVSLREWAKDWGVEYDEGLRGRLNALRLLYWKLKSMGADYTPGRTARKLIMEWLSKPVISYMPDRLELVGGRTQIFYHYAEKVYVYDFNSMYPSVMANTKMPLLVDRGNFYLQVLASAEEKRVKNYVDSLGPVWEATTLEKPPELKNLEFLSRLMKEYYFLKVRIKGFSMGISPPFPFAGEYGNRRAWVYIPEGEYYVAGYEVPLLHGYDYEVLSAYVSPGGYLPFAERVKELYQKRQSCRQKGDRVCEGYYKAVLNAIFGVFGIKQKHVAGKERSEILSRKELRERLKDAVFIQSDEYGNVEVYRYRQKNKKLLLFDSGGDSCLLVERLDEEDYINASVPALAAAIPANGRFLLLWLMKHLLYKGHRVYYCDTDSVHTSCPPEEIKELLGTSLMRLKYEGFYDRVYYFAPKTYYMEKQGKGTLVAKGVKDFEDEIVIYSFNRKEPVVVFRRAIDPDSVPLTIPDVNTPNAEEKFRAILNVKGLKFRETSMHKIYEEIQEKQKTTKSQRRLKN